DTEICSGETTTLEASGAATIIWNATDTMQSIVVAPETNSVYTVEVIDTNGCENEMSVAVKVNTVQFPANIIGLSQFICDTRNAIFLEAFPSGGMFSGTAVSGEYFNPNEAGLGEHIIYYSYSD